MNHDADTQPDLRPLDSVAGDPGPDSREVVIVARGQGCEARAGVETSKDLSNAELLKMSDCVKRVFQHAFDRTPAVVTIADPWAALD